jgi:hypothetical protein
MEKDAEASAVLMEKDAEASFLPAPTQVVVS